MTGLLRYLPCILLVLILMMPLGFLLGSALHGPDVLQGIVSVVYVKNSLILALVSAMLATAFGIVNAWFVVFHSFRGKKFLDLVSFLPISIPAYISAIVYSRLFEYSGPVQTFLRELIHIDTHWFPDIKSLPGIIIIFSSSLYPYVYMTVRASFLKNKLLAAAALTMGRPKIAIFFNVLIPAIRIPAFAGFTIIAMETLSDFGTPHFLGVDTFSTGVYKAWFLLQNENAAGFLSLFNILAIVCIFIIGKVFFRNDFFSAIKANDQYDVVWPVERILPFLCMYGLCLLPIILGFVIPLCMVVLWSIKHFMFWVHNPAIIELILNSVYVCCVTSIVVTLISIVVVYSLDKKSLAGFWLKFLSIGYSIPGAVCTLAMLSFFSQISDLTEKFFGSPILINGTIFALIYSYTFRFLVIGINSVESGKKNITSEIEWSFRLLGYSSVDTYVNIHFCMSWVNIASGMLIIFVDAMKELPITLILRPAGFETLATKMYSLVGDERYEEAAFPSLAIILVCMISVALVYKYAAKNSRDPKQEINVCC